MSNKMQVAPPGVDRVSAPVCGQKLHSFSVSDHFDGALIYCATTMPVTITEWARQTLGQSQNYQREHIMIYKKIKKSC